MEFRTKRILLFLMDLIFVAILTASLIMIILKRFMTSDYPFMLVYIYIQYVVIYLTFRVKHGAYVRDCILNRIHVFNFMFSIFNLIIGYIELSDNVEHGRIY